MIQPRKEPVSLKEMEEAIEKDGYISGIVAVDLGDIIEQNVEYFYDEIVDLLVGDIHWGQLLTDVSWQVVGHQGTSTILLRVEGDPTEIVHNEHSDMENDEEEE